MKLRLKKYVIMQFNVITSILLVIIIPVLVSSLSHTKFHRNEYHHLKKLKPNRFTSMQAACTRDVIMVIATMKDEFHGMLYAKGYPVACHQLGNATTEVKLVMNVTSCGVKIFEDFNQKLVYEVHIYVQYDRTVQQAFDEQILVSCSPVDVIPVSSSKGLRHFGPRARKLHIKEWTEQQTGRKVSQVLVPKVESDEEMDAFIPPITATWMDILTGRTTGGKAIHGHVSVGDEATMLIKIQQKPGIATRVINCLAHDGSGQAQQELIDENGCAIESSIMPPLQEKVNRQTSLKFVYAPFAAFKFPDKDNLHLKCQVLVCIRQCPPKQPCLPTEGRRLHRQPYSTMERLETEHWQITSREGVVVDIIDVFNAFEVQAPQIELDNIGINGESADMLTTQEFQENTTCLSTSRMILTFGILLGVVIIALVFSVSTFVWSRRSHYGNKKWINLPFPSPYDSYS